MTISCPGQFVKSWTTHIQMPRTALWDVPWRPRHERLVRFPQWLCQSKSVKFAGICLRNARFCQPAEELYSNAEQWMHNTLWSIRKHTKRHHFHNSASICLLHVSALHKKSDTTCFSSVEFQICASVRPETLWGDTTCFSSVEFQLLAKTSVRSCSVAENWNSTLLKQVVS